MFEKLQEKVKSTLSNIFKDEPEKVFPAGPYIGSIDNGTSSTRFILFDTKGNIVTSSQSEFPQYYPNAGWTEHDLDEIYEYTVKCIENVCAELEDNGISPSEIKAIGITNQRETTCVWDKETGKPLHKAIVWLDVRTRELVQELINKTESKDAKHFSKKCGLPLSTYFSAVKLKWLLNNVPQVQEAHKDNRLMFGTVDSWLLYKLTGGVHATDVTNASRTMLMDLETLQWDDEICQFFEINKSCLPAIKSSSEVYGNVAAGPLEGVPISGILGDQQSALVGQLCFKQGQLKNTYGTGCFMLCNTGSKPVVSTHGLLTTVGYKLGPEAECKYALEGSIATAGASVKWLRDNMGIIRKASEVGEFAQKVDNTGGVYFVPAFSGLFAPHWRDDARGTIVGITQYTTKEHICRATLEAVSFQTKDIMDSMEIDSGYPINLLRVDGGMTMSDQLMQIQADIAGVEIDRPSMLETTALGAALAAGRAIGLFEDLEKFETEASVSKFKPQISAEQRQEMTKGWKKALEKSMGWV
ncbi:hypothetical protein HDV04_000098 [Boothiomyces sp. JEL0838]|nr:hypothetical protein HDV04_000098 [Boothiomyces sp. JEL0838]